MNMGVGGLLNCLICGHDVQRHEHWGCGVGTCVCAMTEAGCVEEWIFKVRQGQEESEWRKIEDPRRGVKRTRKLAESKRTWVSLAGEKQMKEERLAFRRAYWKEWKRRRRAGLPTGPTVSLPERREQAVNG